MKPDNYTTPPKGDTPKGKIIMKLKKLGTAIEMKKGPQMNIDDHDYRWVDDRIKHMSKGGKYAYKLSKDEMRVANKLWMIYGA